LELNKIKIMECKKEIIVKCVDNCSCLSVDKDTTGDMSDYYVTLYRSYSGKGFWFRVRDAWKALIGKNLSTWDMVLTEEEFNRLRNFE